MLDVSTMSNDDIEAVFFAATAHAKERAADALHLEARLHALRVQLEDSYATAHHAKRVLDWRNQQNRRDGDSMADLARVATSVELGGSVLDIGENSVTLKGRDARQWKVTFTGEAVPYAITEGGIIIDESFTRMEIVDVRWDDAWLIEGTLGSSDIQIRLYGDPVSVEMLDDSRTEQP